MYCNNEQLRKAIVTLAVEKVLLEIGKPIYEKVVNQISKDYKCHLPDCYDSPEYLNQVLKKIFGNSYITVVDSIKKELSEQMMAKPIEDFVVTIGR